MASGSQRRLLQLGIRRIPSSIGIFPSLHHEGSALVPSPSSLRQKTHSNGRTGTLTSYCNPLLLNGCFTSSSRLPGPPENLSGHPQFAKATHWSAASRLHVQHTPAGLVKREWSGDSHRTFCEVGLHRGAARDVLVSRKLRYSTTSPAPGHPGQQKVAPSCAATLSQGGITKAHRDSFPEIAGSNQSHARRSSAFSSPAFFPRQLETTRGFWSACGTTKQHRENKVIGYSPEQLYEVVADVARYKEFVPWCVGSKILWQRANVMEAELEIGFQLLNERYTSRVTFDKPRSVVSTVANSLLFDHLNNRWEFQPGPVPSSCHLYFAVDFQFKSALYQQVADLFFNEVVCYMVSSFEQRCATLYGPPAKLQAFQRA